MALRRTVPLRVKTPMRAVSEKRLAQLRAEGLVNPSSTFAARRPARTNVKRPRDTGPDRATVNTVLERDGYQCVRCGGACHGERGVDWSIQHRRARGMGGSSRPDTSAPQTLILLCGSATTGCHGWVESHRVEAVAYGWAVRQTDDPLTRPVLHSLHGWVYLTADGGWTARRPEAAAT
jgi:hypothetical protein